MKYISILGSTGSIGLQALQVIDSLKAELKVAGLAARSNVDLMEQQIEQFDPDLIALEDELSADILRMRTKGKRTKVLGGLDGVIQVATMPKADTVLSGVSGIAGLIPTLEAIKAGKHIALANKESLVTAGPVVVKCAADAGVNIIPVDGEHSAIFQCLMGYKNRENIQRLILTASGGPFRNKPVDKLRDVSPEQALKHPNWKMGRKITIDSATLMNKGLEVIEARWFFNMDISKIDVIIHPESIIHSMVEFVDGSILAQLGVTDMRLPIQFALTYPERMLSPLPHLDLIEVAQLTFEDVNMEKFPCLKYAYKAGKIGGTVPTVLSSADEVAVDAFLKRKIRFTDIPEVIRQTMDSYNECEFSQPSDLSLDDIITADKWARNFAEKVVLDIK